MEGELQEALALYEDNIAAVQAGLEADPDNVELRQLLGELEEARASTQLALEGLHTTESQAPGIAPASAAGNVAAAAAPREQRQQQPAIGPQLPLAVIGPQLPPGAGAGGRQMHPRNKYATELPDFAALAEEYPSLEPFLQRRGPRPSIDFTNAEACRELTRVLLKHDYGMDWWVPLGQLVPPVTNRANYIHWLEDLLALSSPPGAEGVRGLDVGCGANLIYPLLGAALNGWAFVGVDVTEEGLKGAEHNRALNPHLAPLIEVRRAAMQPEQAAFHAEAGGGGQPAAGRPAKRARHSKGQQSAAAQQQQRQQEGGQEAADPKEAAAAGVGEQGAAANGGAAASEAGAAAEDRAAEAPQGPAAGMESTSAARAAAGEGSVGAATAAAAERQGGGGILSTAMLPGERFAFCMCNPPFFESMAEAGRNPSTAFGGTAAEMVYPGGELAFVEAMAQDSLALGDRIHWYTTMVGKKVTMKALRTLLYRLGVKVLRTTEFVQGKTSRWAVAWSFGADPKVNQLPLPRPPPAAHFAI